MPAHTELSAAKVRNLQGQWGNVVRCQLLTSDLKALAFWNFYAAYKQFVIHT